MTYRYSQLKTLQVACIAVFFASHTHGADLLEVYRLAKEQDATILAARASANAGLERLPQAQAQMLPTISASVSRYQNDLTNSQPNFFGQLQTSDLNYRSGNDSVSIRQPLYRPGLWRQYEQAKSQVAEVRANFALEEQNLAVRVTGAYLDALLAKEQLSTILAQQETTRVQLDAARKFLLGGAGTRTDVDDAQARLDMSSANEIEARQQVEFAQRQLSSLVNSQIDDLAPLDPKELIIELPQPENLEEWLVKALDQSPQIQVLQAQYEQAHLEVSKTRAGHLPTLDAIFQWSRSESENVNSVTSRYTNSSAGVQLNIPIFSGGYVNSAVRQAAFNLERAQQALEYGRRDLKLRVQKEFRGVLESKAKIAALEQALRSADQSLVSSRRSYEGGSRTVLDVLNADQLRMAVLRDLAQARFVYLISNLRLNALVGTADEDAIQKINRYFKSESSVAQ